MARLKMLVCAVLRLKESPDYRRGWHACIEYVTCRYRLCDRSKECKYKNADIKIRLYADEEKIARKLKETDNDDKKCTSDTVRD